MNGFSGLTPAVRPFRISLPSNGYFTAKMTTTTTSTSVHINPVAEGYRRTDMLNFAGNNQGSEAN